jgi:hypothetical protein
MSALILGSLAFASAQAQEQAAPVDARPAYEVPPAPEPGNAPAASDAAPIVPVKTATHKKDDLIGAAERVFGKGAKGLGELMEKILADQGEPNAYIAGREASGAFVVGLRYRSGTLVHKVEGERPVYWTGPSVGFDVGGMQRAPSSSSIIFMTRRICIAALGRLKGAPILWAGFPRPICGAAMLLSFPSGWALGCGWGPMLAI